MNNRTFPDHLYPDDPETGNYEGRILDGNDPENIRKAREDDEFMVDWEWVAVKKNRPDPNGHPLTGTTVNYGLQDTFHEKNNKNPKDVLRQKRHVKQLEGWHNTQANEQVRPFIKLDSLHSPVDRDLRLLKTLCLVSHD